MTGYDAANVGKCQYCGFKYGYHEAGCEALIDDIVSIAVTGFRADVERILADYAEAKPGDMTTEQQCAMVAEASGWRARALKAEAALRALPIGPPAPLVTAEDVARIIDPSAWESFDNTLRPYVEGRGADASKGEAFWCERTYRAGCRTAEDARQWWLENADEAQPVVVVFLRDSLRKGEAVIARLARRAAPAVDKVELDRLREALRRISEGATGYLDRDSDLAEIARAALNREGIAG